MHMLLALHYFNHAYNIIGGGRLDFWIPNGYRLLGTEIPKYREMDMVIHASV
jgi:hypothetical protein